MTLPRVQGERDAIIIAFPLHRVTQAAEVSETAVPETEDLQQRDATVVEWKPGHDVASEEDDTLGTAVSGPRQKRKAHNVALHALAGRSQSRHEIEQRLGSRELPAEVIAEEVAALEQVGFANDTNLAAELVEKYAVRGGLGRRAVAEKLRARHLSREIIEEALSVLTDEDEHEALRAVAEQKARSLRSLDPVVAKRRLVGTLMRKGFNSHDVYAVVNEVLA